MKAYGIAVTQLPAAFQAEITRYDLAQDGVWLTLADGPMEAKNQIADVVKIITGKYPDLEFAEISVVAVKKQPKQISQKQPRVAKKQMTRKKVAAQ